METKVEQHVLNVAGDAPVAEIIHRVAGEAMQVVSVVPYSGTEAAQDEAVHITVPTGFRANLPA